MNRPLIGLGNACFLLLTTSMYFGTGWSMWLFQFPIASQLTPDNYYLAFVPQVAAATAFFTPMTILMLISCCIMIWAEWPTSERWVPIVVLLAVVAATALTKWAIFPSNHEMEAGIKDAARMHTVLDYWMNMNKVRVSLWTVQWLAMAVYFTQRARRAIP